MRHPGSTLCRWEELSGSVLRRVVGFVIDPGSPENADPGTTENTDSVGVVAAALACGAVDGGGPGGTVPRVVGEAGDSLPQAMVAGPAKGDAAAFSGGMGDGADAGFGGELLFGLEAGADVAEFGDDLGGADAAGAREGHHDLAVGQGGDSVLEARRQLGDFGDEGGEDGGERADELPLMSASASPARPSGAARRRASSSMGARRPQ